MRMRNKILIAAGVLVVSTGITVGVLYAVKQSQPAPKDDTSTATVLDHSKDYGACTMLDFATVKQALGSSAATLQQPENMGIVGNKEVGEGVEDLVSDSQLCIYAFETGGTLENGYNSGNAFIIEKRIYINEGGPQALIDQIEETSITTPISGIGDKAFYNANDAATGPDATYSFKLEVFQDKTSIKYMIRVPADSKSFTAETAQTALVKLAKEAKN